MLPLIHKYLNHLSCLGMNCFLSGWGKHGPTENIPSDIYSQPWILRSLRLYILATHRGEKHREERPPTHYFKSNSWGCIQGETWVMGPYAEVDYNCTLSHESTPKSSFLSLGQQMPTNFSQIFKNGTTNRKVRGRGRDGMGADFIS
jgi:hypothetical protein